MRRMMLLALGILALGACSPKQESKVMARFVPERSDDFVFENNLVAGRFYGKALEGNPTSPGIDVWVKLPGKLVADDWYSHAVSQPDYYHHDHGGKDCYKVAVSLGGGASVPVVEGAFAYPSTNYRSYEILSSTPGEVVFVLNYPLWDANGIPVSLSKKVTVKPDTYFIDVEDSYSFEGDSLVVAAGLLRHEVLDELLSSDRVALWETASDQSVEPEDGKVGVALVLKGADSACVLEGHSVALKTIRPGEKVNYSFASCWSKAGVPDSKSWFEIVSKQ